MKIMFVFFFLLMMNKPCHSSIEAHETQVDILDQVIGTAWSQFEAAPNIYPHYLVYGLEIEATAGLADIAELGSSLGIELHFERRVK